MIGLALSFPAAEAFAQSAAERVLNSLPEGLLLAGCATLLLRLIGKENAGTRFAVWLVALVGVAALPLLGGMSPGGHALLVASHAEVTMPGIWGVIFVALWVLLACVALARLVAGLLQVRRLRNGCEPVSPAALDSPLRAILETEDAGKGRRVRLLVSEAARVPAAIGFRNPAIVLPAWCLRELSVDELRPILIHELAHLRRRDDWTNLFQKFVRAIFFFHPAVWWIDARLSLEREMACDDAVLAATGNPHAYAGSLIGLLERGCARRGWTMAQAAVARAREASVRIARILAAKTSPSTRVGRGALAIAGGLCVAASGLLLVAPQMVEFSPEQSSPQAQLAALHEEQAASPLRPQSAVVPALYHPASAAKAAAPQKQLVRSKIIAQKPSLDLGSGRSTVRDAKPVVMAKLDETVRTSGGEAAASVQTMQVFMVVETAYAPEQPTPADRPEGDQSGQAESTREAMAQPAFARQTAVQAVQVQTLQVLEETEAGWQVRTYRVVLMVPATEESMHASI